MYVVVFSFLAFGQKDEALVGRFEVIASITKNKIQPEKPRSTWNFQFNKNGTMVWYHTDSSYSGIPRNGAKMSISLDSKASPKRLKIWFLEAAKENVFSYGKVRKGFENS